MSSQEELREKINMYEQCITALGDVAPGTCTSVAMTKFLTEECNRLRDDLQELEDGTHELWAPFKEMLSSDDPEAVAMRYRGAKVVERMQQRRRDMQRWSDIARQTGPAFPIITSWNKEEGPDDDDD